MLYKELRSLLNKEEIFRGTLTNDDYLTYRKTIFPLTENPGHCRSRIRKFPI